MTEENQENKDSPEEPNIKNEVDEKTEEKPKEQSKKTFSFKCTRCDDCCAARGPIPISFWDLEMWARNGVVANFMPYLDIYHKPDGGIDLVLKPLPPPSEKTEE